MIHLTRVVTTPVSRATCPRPLPRIMISPTTVMKAPRLSANSLATSMGFCPVITIMISKAATVDKTTNPSITRTLYRIIGMNPSIVGGLTKRYVYMAIKRQIMENPMAMEFLTFESIN